MTRYRRGIAAGSRVLPEDHILLLDQGEVATGGWGIPFAHAGKLDDLPEGYDAALVHAVDDHESGPTPTAFSFIAAGGLGHVFAPVMVIPGTVRDWEQRADMVLRSRASASSLTG